MPDLTLQSSQSGDLEATGSMEEENEVKEENDLMDLEELEDSTDTWAEEGSSDDEEEWSSEAETSEETLDLAPPPPAKRRKTRGYLKAHPSERSPFRDLSSTEAIKPVFYKRCYADDTPVELIEIHGPAFTAPDVIEVYRRTKAAFDLWIDYDLENGPDHQLHVLAARYLVAKDEWHRKKVETIWGKDFVRKLQEDHAKELLKEAEANCSAQAGPSDNSVEM